LLRLSSFLNLSFNHRLKLSDDQYTFGYSFFYELAELEVEKPYNNNLFNGVRDLTNNTKTSILSTDEGKKKAAKFITNWLIPSIQPLTFHDFLSCIVSLIENDETISDKNKKDLLKLFSDGKNDVFLYKSFMYAIAKENIDIKSTIAVDDAEFVFEANKKCSLCNTSIEVKKSKGTAYKYGITNIFPEGLSNSLKSDFIKIHKEPADYYHRSNKICCCIACADDYEATPTTDKFIKLLSKKEHYNKTNQANSCLERAKLDEQLNSILKELKNLKSFDDIADFRKTPLELKDKIIDNEPLRLTIKTDVDSYYNYLRKQLSDLDDVGSEFRIIASQFQICYEKLLKVMSDQEDIYNRIIKWVLEELGFTEKYYTAARIIVSFFVQNCEVFDEISK
jgi:hypothetical protein